jgi:tetratricopeptide (TPR) repeat protein
VKRAVALLALSLSACPPPRVATPVVVPAGTTADSALRDAEAAFAKRPVLEQSLAAVGLFEQAAAADPKRTEGSMGVVRAGAWFIEHGPKDSRKAMVERIVAAGEQCQQRAPGDVKCAYWQAVAMGLQAREQPLNALGMLPKIIELLKKADAAEPQLDDAGPARVLSLVLVRAPGWPTGPGNPDDALLLAKHAVELAPSHPLNTSALAECLAATGETDAAKAAYVKAGELGRAKNDADGADWAAQAELARSKL